MRGNRFAARCGVVIAAVIAASSAHVAATPALADLIGNIAVTTTSDASTGTDGLCSLREAIVAANTDTALPTSGECAAGGTGIDFISFSFTAPSVIRLASDLPALTGTTTITGATSPTGALLVTIDGQDLHRPLLVANGASVVLDSLAISNGFTGAPGGGLRNDGTVTMRDASITSSSASAGAGAIYNIGTLTLDRVTLSGNSTTSNGGALLLSNGSTATLLNTTIHGNTADRGGGIENEGGTLTIDFSTITKNTATIAGTGGGIRQTSGTIHLWSSIVSGNTGGNVSAAGSSSTKANLVDVGTTTLLASGLADNGGPTKTVALLATATAALDAGDASGTCPSADQRGIARANGTCDIGAVERDSVAPTLGLQPTQLRQGVALSGTSVRAALYLVASDDGAGAGIDHFTIQRQYDGGAWTTITNTLAGTALGEGAVVRAFPALLKHNHVYRFRVRVVDQDGNASAWKTSPNLRPKLIDQTSSSVIFNSGWTKVTSTKHSGGSARKATSMGRTVRITFTGRALTFVTTFRPGANGTATATVDGVAVAVPNFSSSVTKYRMQGYSVTFPTSGTHTIRIITTGSTRVDADAFAILK